MNGLSHDSHLPNVRAYVAPDSTPRPSRQPFGVRPQTEGGERKRFVAKGHDAQLQDLQFTGREVRITTMSGLEAFGKVIRRDKFTITLELAQGTEAGAHEIFYKHAIESVQIKSPAPTAEENTTQD